MTVKSSIPRRKFDVVIVGAGAQSLAPTNAPTPYVSSIVKSKISKFMRAMALQKPRLLFPPIHAAITALEASAFPYRAFK